MCTMARGDLIRDLDVPCQQNKCFSILLQPPHLQEHNKSLWNIPVINAPVDPSGDLGDEVEDESGAGFASQRDRLIWAMNQCGWVQAKAARLLNLSARQMGYALKKYNIPIKRF
jgi:Nif-specific regulatory protein